MSYEYFHKTDEHRKFNRYKDITVSGVRPTGRQHLGNYFGAVVNFVKMQDLYNGFFFIADYHSLTTHPRPEDLRKNVKQIVVEYLACGLDPNKCSLYLQSDIKKIPELYLIFNMFAYKGELERSATFKDKVRDNPDNVNAGLLTYPVLMAVDIIIQRAHKVPVGKDQKQHLEMTRDFVMRFNKLHNVNYFPEPEPFNFEGNLVSIPSLDGEGKMSKSKGENTCIYLSDSPDVILSKIKKAPTNITPSLPNLPKPIPVQNLFDLLKLVSNPNDILYFEHAWNNCTIRFGDLKHKLATDMAKYLEPIRNNILEIQDKENYIREVLGDGADRANRRAYKTLKDVREIIGIKSF